MTIQIEFPRFFSIDSPKAVKSLAFGFLNAINYMAPHKNGDGRKNLCSNASPGCIELCLGEHSGQAAMRKEGETNNVVDSRRRKARYFLQRRVAFMREMCVHIARAMRTAARKGLTLVVRPNGSTDLPFENIRFFVDAELAAEIFRVCGVVAELGLHTIFSLFPMVQFVDYTKNPNRFYKQLPPNYSLTFSRSETNEEDCLWLLQHGVNVAVVFGDAEQPATWNGYTVIDGDEHDLRHLDPFGVVVGLTPKGAKAKRSTSGFVLRHAT